MPHATVTSWTLWRGIALALFVICLLWGLLPLLTIRIHVGCVAMIAVGGLGTAVCLFWPRTVGLWQRVWATGFGRVALATVSVLAAALILLFVVASVIMTVAACRPAQENATVLVLGAGLRGDRPSRILRERLDAAYAYLIAHPEAACVLSGGQGPDEWCTEAAAMKAYLLEKGIDESRLYLEERSTSTAENLAFSRELMEREGLSLSVALVTQEFHQCRAQAFAKKQGFTQVGAITAHTQWELFPSYWIRDFAGLCHMVVFGS